MATNTTNYNLTKPDSDDAVDISVLNQNFETLDTELKRVADKNIIKTFTIFSQLDIQSSDISSSNLASNLTTIIEKLPTYSRFIRFASAKTDNFSKSIAEKLNTDLGITLDSPSDYTIQLDFIVLGNKTTSIEIIATINHSTSRNMDTYSAIYSKGSLSRFTRNHPVDYYWNLTPENSGHNSLLSYMDDRYDDHPVVFAYVKDFFDLPSGVEGQATINITGGIMSVEVQTLDGVYHRRTNSRTEWTEEWGFIPEVKNHAMTVDGSIGAKNSTTNRTARMHSHNNTAQEIDITNFKDDNNYQGIRVKKEDSDLSNAVNLVRMANGTFTSYPIYHAGNKPKAADVGAAQIKYGTYVGTGESGVSNPITLSADFDIKLAIIYKTNMGFLFGDSSSGSSYQYGTNTVMIGKGARQVQCNVGSPTLATLNVSWGTNKLSFYHNESNAERAEHQFNADGVEYHYILIG